MPDDLPQLEAPKPPTFDVEAALSRMQEQINGIVEMLTNDRAERAASAERSAIAPESDTGSGDTPAATENAGASTEEPDRRPNNTHWFFKKRSRQ